jgi:hypothetical protein
MSKVENNEDRFGGQYMIQDRDHMSENDQAKDKPNRGGVRQSEQSQSGGRQQGSSDNRENSQQGGGRRQAH